MNNHETSSGQEMAEQWNQWRESSQELVQQIQAKIDTGEFEDESEMTPDGNMLIKIVDKKTGQMVYFEDTGFFQRNNRQNFGN